MPDTGTMLSLRGITKSFPGVRALSEVDFEVRCGEVVSLIGRNGAGKSTLMSVVGGIYPPDEGEVSVAGEVVQITNASVGEQLGIGFVHQEPTLVPNLTVAANVYLNRELSRGGLLDLKRMRKASAEIIGALGFEIDPDRLAEDLTLVEKEVVEIAKAMLFQPRILILDEVTAPLNGEEVEHLFGIVSGLKDKGIAIIFISHRLDEVIRVSDRVVVLRDGKNAGELSREQGLSEKALISLMLGEIHAESFVSAQEACSRAEVMLSVQHLTKAPDFTDIDFELYCGEILGFSGLKGSGITELFKTLYGIYGPDEGQVFVQGRRVVIGRPSDAIKNGIGMLTNDRQKEGLALRRDLEENITISSLGFLSNRLTFFRPAVLRRRAADLARALSIRAPSMTQDVVNLSGGNQQKVVLAKWLLRDLNVIVADEPTRGVDVRAKDEMYNLLMGLKREGKAVIVFSPEIAELLTICDRILVVDAGRLCGSIDRNDSEFNEHEILRLMHVGAAEGERAGASSMAGA
jgi:ABC-type sugar transport system ATPase subunit